MDLVRLRADAAVPHLRIARPTRSLAAASPFWEQGLGMQVLWRSAPGEHRLLMLGWPEAAWHLELVEDTEVEPSPTEEDLLVLYLDRPVDDDDVQRLVDAGGRRVTSRNPYWEQWGVTVEDPDGYRLVLSSRGWSNGGTAPQA